MRAFFSLTFLKKKKRGAQKKLFFLREKDMGFNIAGDDQTFFAFTLTGGEENTGSFGPSKVFFKSFFCIYPPIFLSPNLGRGDSQSESHKLHTFKKNVRTQQAALMIIQGSFFDLPNFYASFYFIV